MRLWGAVHGTREGTLEQEQAQRVRAVIEKVRVFRRLSVGEAAQLIKFCQLKSYGQNQMVYRAGDPSDEMLILLQGRLSVINESGTVLGYIEPGTTTGEMGVLTDQPRSATILATENSSGFVIKKNDLRKLLRDDGLRLKVYENMVGILCERLASANLQMETYASKGRGH